MEKELHATISAVPDSTVVLKKSINKFLAPSLTIPRGEPSNSRNRKRPIKDVSSSRTDPFPIVRVVLC